MREKRIMYSYEDVMIEPAVITDINNSTECNPKDENRFLPILTAPTSSVISTSNSKEFEKYGIYPIIPKTESREDRLLGKKRQWVAVSLEEFEEIFVKDLHVNEGKFYVMIDVENGHVKKIYDLIRAAKEKYGDNLEVMVRNISNPETYEWIVKNVTTRGRRSGKLECLVDYICLEIGYLGVGVNYPMASLITEVSLIRRGLAELKEEKGLFVTSLNIPVYGKLPKIVAGGEITRIEEVIKALALGADYVMIEAPFCGILESNSETYCRMKDSDFGYEKSTLSLSDWRYKGDGLFYNILDGKEYEYELQKRFRRTLDDVLIKLPVRNTLKTWTQRMNESLREAMMVAGARTLKEFHPVININTCSYRSVIGG